MRILLVYAHPCRESFVSGLKDMAVETLTAGGHEVSVVDLYDEGFSAVLTAEERRAYHDEGDNLKGIERHVELLRQTEALVLVYPTWWYGMPAILKGWFDRVWVPGVAFKMPAGPNQPLRPALSNIKTVTVITTAGAPNWFTWFYMGHPAKKVLMRGIRMLCAPGAKGRWYCHYSMDSSTPESRTKYLEKVRSALKSL